MHHTSSHNTNSTGSSSRPLGIFFKFVVPVIISAGLCWLMFRHDSLGAMLEVINTKCDFTWIAVMLFVALLSNVFRALRWGIQLDAVGIHCSFTDLLYSIFGTYAVNLVFPRLGEVWRTGFIAQRRDANFGTVFGTMIADRFADLIVGLTLTLVTLVIGYSAIASFVEHYPDGYRQMLTLATSPWLWGAIAVSVIAVVIIVRHSHGRIVSQAREFALELWKGFASIISIRHKGLWLALTFMLWGCYLLQMYLSFLAFPFTREILSTHGFTAVLICFTLGTIAMGIPSNGGIGPYQIAIIFGLMLYCPDAAGTTAAKAFELDSKAFANLILTSSTLLTIALGLWTFAAIALRSRRRH